MQGKERSGGGYTLVELLVVMAIFAALVGLAIPAIGRAGGFTSNDPDIAARELYASLRAARTYATTYRVDTAVVYGLAAPEDSASETNEQVQVIHSYGVVRKLTEQEIRSIRAQANCSGTPELEPQDPDSAYILINDYEAKFRRLPEGACVLSINNAYEPVLGVAADGTTPTEGLVPIVLYEAYIGDDPCDPGVTSALVYQRIAPSIGSQLMPFADPTSWPADFPDFAMPAHIFTPAGPMEPQASPVARFTLNIAPMPDAQWEDRFAIQPGDVDPDSGPPPVVLPEGQLKVPVRIELYRTTGRVKMTS